MMERVCHPWEEDFVELGKLIGCSLQSKSADILENRVEVSILNVIAWQLFRGIIATACKNSGAARKC